MPEIGEAQARREHMRTLGRIGAQSKKVLAVERRIRELVESAPPLTDAQRDRLALLLSGGNSE